jgi:tetratricopeptide (TPR) repeat protein
MSGKNEVQELLERGLHSYGLGEVPQALSFWQQALAKEPGNRTAAEYIEIATGQAMPAPESAPETAAPAEDSQVSFSAEFLEGQRRLFYADWTGAIRAFESAFKQDPDHPLYHPHVELARARLIRDVMYQLEGSFPRLAVPVTQLMNRKDMTQEDGFVLSLINGDLGLSDLVSLSPLPRFSTYQILHRLLSERLIVAGAGP